MSWESWVGAALGAALGLWLGKFADRPRRPYRPRDRRYAMALIRRAVATAQTIPDSHEAVTLWVHQHAILAMVPRRQKFDRWHATMVLEVLRRRCKAIERRMEREARYD